MRPLKQEVISLFDLSINYDVEKWYINIVDNNNNSNELVNLVNELDPQNVCTLLTLLSKGSADIPQ